MIFNIQIKSRGAETKCWFLYPGIFSQVAYRLLVAPAEKVHPRCVCTFSAGRITHSVAC